MNEGWKEDMGGHLFLELDKDNTINIPVPFGQVVIFRSDSFEHGSRQSFFPKRVLTYFLSVRRSKFSKL